MEASFGTELEAMPLELLQWVTMCWSVEVTIEEAEPISTWKHSGKGQSQRLPAPLPSCWPCARSSRSEAFDP
jgi:hypothetical protein